MGLLRTSLIVSGALPNLVQPKYRFVVYFAAVFYYFMYCVLLLGSILNIYYTDDFFRKCTESCHFLIVSAHYLLTQATFQYNQNEFIVLFDDIIKNWNIASANFKNKDIFDSVLLSVKGGLRRFIFIFIVVPTSTTIVSSVLDNFIFKTDDTVKLPLQIWVPQYFQERALEGCIYQIIVYFFCLIMVSTNAFYLFGITLHLKALGLSLANDFEDDFSKHEKARLSLYKRHVNLLKVTWKLSDLLGFTWAFDAFCSGLQTIFPAFRTYKAIREGDPFAMYFAYITSLSLAITYIIFHSGNILYTTGETLRTSIYRCHWQETTAKVRRELVLVINLANKGLNYKYKTFWFVHRPTFTSVLQSIYSSLTMLLFLDSKTTDYSTNVVPTD